MPFESGASGEALMGKPADEKTRILQDNGRTILDEIIVEEDEKSHKSSFLGVTFNYVNAIIGSGVIGVPFIFREAGVLIGAIILLFIAFIGDFSLVLIMKGGHVSSTTSYQDMMQAAFGMPGYFILSVIQFMFPYIAMVSYNVIVGDTITRVVSRLIGQDILWARDIVTLITSLCFTLPLCLYRNIGKLSKSSFLSFLLIIFIIASVLARYAYYREIVPELDGDWNLANPSGILSAISIATFAFVCHHNTFFLYESLHEPELTKWKSVTHTSVGISLITMATMGLAGYSTFRSAVQGDLLNNYCWSDDLMNICRITFALTVLLTYPLENFACREVLKMVIWRNGQLSQMEPKMELFYHVAVTVGLVLTTFLLSTATDCLGIVLELNGLLAAIPLAFILPAVCYLKLEDGPLFSTKKIGSLCLALFGIGATTVGIVSIAIQGIENCEAGGTMPYCIQDIRALNLSVQT